MKIFKLTLITILLITSGNRLSAQSAKEKLLAERIAFFTEKMALTPDEAAVFWPIYNEYKFKSQKINRQTRDITAQFEQNADKLSDKEIQNLLNKRIILMNNKVILDEDYQKKFLEILPPKKVMLIYTTEAEFKTYLLQQLRNSKNKNIPGIRN